MLNIVVTIKPRLINQWLLPLRHLYNHNELAIHLALTRGYAPHRSHPLSIAGASPLYEPANFLEIKILYFIFTIIPKIFAKFPKRTA